MIDIITQSQQNIDDTVAELIKMAEYLSKLQPVSPKSKSLIQFHGGVLGGIREYREGKRMIKLINEPLYNDLSFYKVSYHIIEKAELLVKNQLEIQSLLTQDDDVYFSNIKPIIESINLCINAWYNYSPDMATEGLTIGDEKNVSLLLTVREYTKEEFIKLNLPSEYEHLRVTTNNGRDSNSGCFGAIIGLITLSGGLLSLILFLVLC